MAQLVTEEKTERNHVWPKALLLNQAYAMTFECVKCNEIPMSCMANEDGDVLCHKCAENIENTRSSKPIQKMINKLKTRCLTIKTDNQQNKEDNVEGMIIMATQIKDNQCDWTGTINEYDEHSKECSFLLVQCAACKVFKSPRKLINNHIAECAEATIDCPLSCGSVILRKNTQTHLANECAEKMLDCTNEECKIQIKRKDFTNHVNNECDVRLVQCAFVKYGCSAKGIKSNQLEQHMDDYKLEHISNKMDFITAQFNDKLAEQNDTISQLIHSNKSFQSQISAQNETISQLKSELDESKSRLTEMEEKKDEPLWKNAVYSESDTGTVKDNKYKCLIHMILPEKAGKYVCKYSFIGHAKKSTDDDWWITYWFKLGEQVLCSNVHAGVHLNQNQNESNGFPLCGSAIVELTGTENQKKRKLGLYHKGRNSYPSGMKRCCIECYEIH